MIAFFVFAFLAACISYFFDFCTWDGNIFSFYRRWYSNFPPLIQKPLGACIYCFNTWVSFAVYAYLTCHVNTWISFTVYAYMIYRFEFEPIWIIPFVSLSYFILRIFNKLKLDE